MNGKTNPSLLNEIVQELYHKYKDNNDGSLATYIPELAKAKPQHFGISITTVDGETISAGDCEAPFTIQSVSKPFVFGMALEKHGMEHVRSKVGVEPSGEPFHSIIKLDTDSKRPSNPLVNAGAIAMTDLVKGANQKEGRDFLQKSFEAYVGHPLNIDLSVYESEIDTGHRNRAIAHLMLHFGMIDKEIEKTVDLYFRQCSFIINSSDLSTMAATLAKDGINPKSGERALEERYVKSLLTLMLTCGLYTYAGEWAFNVGIPAKSGVSGGILGVVPGRMGIGVYSPLVDSHGNSVRGVKVFEELSQKLKLHVLEKNP